MWGWSKIETEHEHEKPEIDMNFSSDTVPWSTVGDMRAPDDRHVLGA